MKRFQRELIAIGKMSRRTRRLAFLGTTVVAVAAIGGCSTPSYPRKLMSELESEAASQQLSEADSNSILVTYAGPPAKVKRTARSSRQVKGAWINATIQAQEIYLIYITWVCKSKIKRKLSRNINWLLTHGFELVKPLHRMLRIGGQPVRRMD